MPKWEMVSVLLSKSIIELSNIISLNLFKS